jgi:hypothetical protein
MPSQRKSRSTVSSKAMMEEVKNLAIMSAGVVAGALGGKMVDKVLKVDPAAGGLNAKAMVRPALLIGVGAYGALKPKNPMVRLLSAGVGASGILSAIKVLTKKDLLAGMSGIDGYEAMGSDWNSVYQDAGPHRYHPELPALSAGDLSDASGVLAEAVDGPASDAAPIEII